MSREDRMTPAHVRRRLILAAVTCVSILQAVPATGQDVLGETGTKGAGSTFVYPVLSRWSREYRAWVARGGDYPGLEASLDDPPASSALEYEPGWCASRIGRSTSPRRTCR
jgi:phosphate transport system substrate-binding protein